MKRETHTPRTIRGRPGSGALWILAPLIALLTSSASTGLAATEMPQQCTLTFVPGAVVSGSTAQEVQATASEEVRTASRVRAADESGLRVSLQDRDRLLLAVDASDATPGEWQIHIDTEDGESCSGTLRVEEGYRR